MWLGTKPGARFAFWFGVACALAAIAVGFNLFVIPVLLVWLASAVGHTRREADDPL